MSKKERSDNMSILEIEGLDGYDTPTVGYDESGAENKAIEYFCKTYLRKPMYNAFTPYRICPLGAHSDHQLGKITGFAIDKGISIS